MRRISIPLKDHEIAGLINMTTKSLHLYLLDTPNSLRQIVSHAIVESLFSIGAREDHADAGTEKQ